MKHHLLPIIVAIIVLISSQVACVRGNCIGNNPLVDSGTISCY